MKIIQLGQSSRQGKDTFADYFIETAEAFGKKVFRIAYADKLKDIVCERLKVTRNQLEFMKNNEQKIIDYIVAAGLSERAKDPDVFTDEVNGKIGWAFHEDFDYVVVTDLRFPEETRSDAIKINIVRPGFEAKSKVDNQLHYETWDYHVLNDHSIQHLASQAETIFKDIENKG